MLCNSCTMYALCNSCSACKMGHCLVAFSVYGCIIVYIKMCFSAVFSVHYSLQCPRCSVQCLHVCAVGTACRVSVHCAVCIACVHTGCVLRAWPRRVAGFTDSSSSGSARGTFVAGKRRNSGSTASFQPKCTIHLSTRPPRRN